MTAKKPDPPVEISFSLAVGDQPPEHFKLTGTNATVRIGRRLDSDIVLQSTSVSWEHCEFFLRRKNRDPILCIKDTSRNKTGVRHPTVANPSPAWQELAKDQEEVLQHRSEILVPARQKRKAAGAGDDRVLITVLFALPDAYCPWTRVGRWEYVEKLGEGGLATVYRARDVHNDRRWVAIKVSKFTNIPPASQLNRHIYALHREARWSIERLHNKNHKCFESGGAVLFARYLEDHTGFAQHAPGKNFDVLRRHFEDPSFSWLNHHFNPPLSPSPYVVMEFIDGRLLQQLLERDRLDLQEQRMVVRQCCKALVYMQRFSVVHRDFRGCNIFLLGRGPRCLIKVIDLGFMIGADSHHERNPNPAVRCAWQGDPEKKIRFDWAPPEVRVRGGPNFALPACSFDVFSFGVLLLKMLQGRTWAQDVLATSDAATRLQYFEEDVKKWGLTADVLIRMVEQHDPLARPLPSDILQVLNSNRESSDR